MRLLYTLLMYVLTPYLLLRLWWKGRKLPAYRKRIAERFFLSVGDVQPVDVWIHAVSLGEVIAATPLIDALLQEQRSVLVTTMTPTGSERVQVRFGSQVRHQYVPYDLPIVLKRFFKQLKPRVGVIMETELWPNLIDQAERANVPLLLANARLSEKSLRGYLKLKTLFKPVLNQFKAILVQSEADARHFIDLGASAKLVQVLGNMKFDLQTNAVNKAQFDALKKHWGKDRIVVIAASTHEDEEAQILGKLKRLQEAIPQLVLLIAPRHPERFKAVVELCVERGFNTGLRSDVTTLSAKNDVVVLDSLGELLGFFQISNYAFVGGSLVPVGGHNVLEPIAMNVPVVSGHYVQNFKTICYDLQEAGGLCLVRDVNELVNGIIKLHNDSEYRNTMVSNARAVLLKNKGAVARYLRVIEKSLN